MTVQAALLSGATSPILISGILWPLLYCCEDDGKVGRGDYIDHDAEVVASAMDAEHNILVGHSYGGMVALAIALKYPQRVDGLILEPGLCVIRESIEDKEAVEATIAAFLEKGFENPKLWIEILLDYWNGDGAYKRMTGEQKLPF